MNLLVLVLNVSSNAEAFKRGYRHLASTWYVLCLPGGGICSPSWSEAAPWVPMPTRSGCAPRRKPAMQRVRDSFLVPGRPFPRMWLLRPVLHAYSRCTCCTQFIRLKHIPKLISLKGFSLYVPYRLRKSRIGGLPTPLGRDRNGEAKRLGLEILVACEGRASGVSCRVRRPIWQPIGYPAAPTHPPHAIGTRGSLGDQITSIEASFDFSVRGP